MQCQSSAQEMNVRRQPPSAALQQQELWWQASHHSVSPVRLRRLTRGRLQCRLHLRYLGWPLQPDKQEPLVRALLERARLVQEPLRALQNPASM